MDLDEEGLLQLKLWDAWPGSLLLATQECINRVHPLGTLIDMYLAGSDRYMALGPMAYPN